VNRQRTLEWEERWAVPAAICAFAAAALFIGGTVAAQQGPVSPGSTTELLREYYDVRGTMALGAGLNAISLFLLAPVLYYLFQAAAARSASVRRGLVGVVVAGPVFLGVAEVLQYVAISNAASDFATPGGGAGIPIGEYAEDLIRDQAVFGFAQGLSFAGILGFVIGVIYTALWAMRVGLVTRFFGTFGMALGASLILLAQAFSLLALMLWSVWLGLIYIDRVPRGRPPAWEAGEARPWPKAGEQPAPERDDDDDAVEGEAAELFSNGAGEDENPNAARRERAKKRKRKRRG
jgi:hypothetical protein